MNYYNNQNAFKPTKDNPILLDFSLCKYPEEIHRVLKESFGFPEYYGENWDAFFDCLDDRFSDFIPYDINIHGYNTLSKELKNYCSSMFRIFDDICKEHTNITYKIVS